jgi:hypothetical protein
VEAVGRIPAEQIANYVRKRVRVDGVELGAARTVFDRASVLGDSSGHLVRVEVEVSIDGTRLVVRSLAPHKMVDPNLTPEERRKKFGLDPKGAVIDPSHL